MNTQVKERLVDMERDPLTVRLTGWGVPSGVDGCLGTLVDHLGSYQSVESLCPCGVP